MMKRIISFILLLSFIPLAWASDLATLRPKHNATVPVDAPIQPPQAFVDGMTKGLSNGSFNPGNAAVDLSDIGMESLDPAVMIHAEAANIDLSDNPLTEAAIVATMVYIATLLNAAGTADLSGSEAADCGFIPEKQVVQIPAGIANDQQWQWTNDGRDFKVGFSTSLTLASSLRTLDQSSDWHMTIGISDSPTPSQIAAKIATLSSGYISHIFRASAVGDTITFREFDWTFWDPEWATTLNTANLVFPSHTDGVDPGVEGVLAAGRTLIVNVEGEVHTFVAE